MRLLLAVVIAAGLAQAHHWFFQPMDGSAWDVRVKKESLFAFSHKDTLVFRDGRLTVASAAKEGIAPAGYSARRAGKAPQAWTAMLDEAGATARWEGTVRADRIEGFVVRSRADGRETRYRFSGKRRS